MKLQDIAFQEADQALHRRPGVAPVGTIVRVRLLRLLPALLVLAVLSLAAAGDAEHWWARIRL